MRSAFPIFTYLGTWAFQVSSGNFILVNVTKAFTILILVTDIVLQMNKVAIWIHGISKPHETGKTNESKGSNWSPDLPFWPISADRIGASVFPLFCLSTKTLVLFLFISVRQSPCVLSCLVFTASTFRHSWDPYDTSDWSTWYPSIALNIYLFSALHCLGYLGCMILIRIRICMTFYTLFQGNDILLQNIGRVVML